MKDIKNIYIKFFILTLLIIIGFSCLSLTTNSYSQTELEKANFIASKGIIMNHSTNPANYRLGDTITRKETMKIIINLSGLKVNNQCEGKFADVSNDWGCRYIEKALSSGFVSNNTYFRPDDSITKIEVIKLILKAKGIEKIEETSNWQKDYMETAYKHGIIDKKYTDYDTVVTRGWIFYAIANTYNIITIDTISDNEVIEEDDNKTSTDTFSSKLMTINYNGITVDAYVNQSEELPKDEKVDVIVAYHGTAIKDSEIHHAAESIATKIRNNILNNSGRNLVIISIVYHEEDVLMGDNVIESEAAFLRVKNNAAKELNLNINKVFLLGHSQGAYIVARLNTMHNSDGVISNSPGPLDLVLRCQHDEKTLNEYKEPPKETGIICYNLYKKYGSVNTNPTEYKNRSGLNFVSGYKSDILFIQGLDDPNPFQQTSRPKFVEAVKDGSHEGNYTFLDLDGFGHGAIFDSAEAKAKVVEFLK